ncbi:GMC oxidoreductase [Limibacter armeniacum]|uniref:GMC oxidoreductase n=1 Tax=Limibacter armeniacum TaxID=466084 RepID=UPI002FE66716
MENYYDYIVIGSGFGGSVSAMRLSEKGYSVLLIEKGKRIKDKDFPKSDWNIRKFLWAPLLRCFGFQKLTFFKEVFILGGVGVGGGSNVYGNTHMIPGDEFFENKVWAHYRDWEKTLTPFYDKAKFMLGTIPYTDFHREDEILKEVARDMGKEESFGGVNIGVYYGDPNKEIDPYFKGLGPARKGCQKCAGCMIGCRHNAKNTLEKNYLYFAEKFGTEILPETLATSISHDGAYYTVETKSSTKLFGKEKKSFRAKGLVVSGGVIGTLKMLLSQKFENGTLSKLSDKLGSNIRTNSEMLCGIANTDEKLNHGVAISSYFNPDKDTHIEVVKYNTESGAMGRLAAMAAGPGPGVVRIGKMIGHIISKPRQFLKATFKFRKWGDQSLILLVMQSLEESMKMVWKKGLFGGSMKFDSKSSKAVSAYIDIGQQVLYRYAEKVNGTPQNVLTEILFNTPMTAHILGGCPMGKNADEGVVNDKFEVNGYPNMYVLDGSIIPCNLGVNPSLTITTLSEYAMAQIPKKDGYHGKSLDEMLKEIESKQSVKVER